MLLFMEGFDNYANSQGAQIQDLMLSSLYVQAISGGGLTLDSNTGSGFGWSVVGNRGSGGPAIIRRAFNATDTIITGFRIKCTPTDFVTFFRLLHDNLLGNVATQFSLGFNDVAGISMVNGNGVLIANSDVNVVFPNVWNYIEVKVVAGQTGGSCIVKLNGAVIISLGAGQTIVSGGAPSYNLIDLTATANDGNPFINWDDWYVCDGSGSDFNDFLGDVVVHGLNVVSDSTPNQFTQTGGTVGHFTSVNDIPPDEDSSYLSTTTSGLKELFGVSTIPPDVIDVLAVSVHVRARKDSAGLASMFMAAKLGASETDSPNITLTTAYQTYGMYMTTQPNGSAWTKTDAQNITVGFGTPS